MPEPKPVRIQLQVNGKQCELEVEPRMLLVELIRDMLDLTGTHVGCDTTYCGACTVLLNRLPVKSCTVLAVQADRSEVLTVEGLATDGELHPIQQAFLEQHALQCGYCTPGMQLAAYHLLAHNSQPNERDIRKAIAGNTCRCTGYQNIFRAIECAAGLMRR
jgi:aerobic carbon-monoxide dehydrogenase small subunit